MASSWRSSMECSCPDSGRGCREGCVRSVCGCQAVATAGPRQLQGSHSRVHVSPATTTAVPQGKHLFTKSKTLPISNEWGRTRGWDTALQTQREGQRRSRSSEQRYPVRPWRDQAGAGQQHKEGAGRGVDMDWHHGQGCSACDSCWQEICLHLNTSFSILFSPLSHWGSGAASSWVASQG